MLALCPSCRRRFEGLEGSTAACPGCGTSVRFEPPPSVEPAPGSLVEASPREDWPGAMTLVAGLLAGPLGTVLLFSVKNIDRGWPSELATATYLVTGVVPGILVVWLGRWSLAHSTPLGRGLSWVGMLIGVLASLGLSGLLLLFFLHPFGGW